MFELRHPELLALFAVAPALWWLHRLRDRGIDHSVAALFLWRTSISDMSRGMQIAAADPAWRRRVAFVFFACLAMAGPLYLSNKPAVTVWVDDSPSMYVSESGETRLALAADELSRKLEDKFAGELTLRSLADPARSLRADTTEALSQSLRSWPVANNPLTPPPPALMERDRQHWLVSDGADRDVAAWASGAPLSGIVRIGSDQNNTAVSAITARASAHDTNVLDVQIHIDYTGTAADSRTLTVTGVDDSGRQRIDLTPGRSQIIAATAMRGRDVEARLDPPDALPMDDSLTLPGGASAALSFRVIGDCPATLTDALAVIPKLEPADAADPLAALIIACAPAARTLPDTGEALMFFLTPDSPPRRVRSPVWSTEAGALQNIAIDNVSGTVIDLPPGTAATPILSSDRGPLISLQQETGRAPAVYVGVDIADSAWVGQPSFVLLVARLAELVAGQPLLDPIDAVARITGDEEISPRYELRPRDVDVIPSSTGRDIAAWLILAALLLVLLDLGVLVGNARRAAAPAAGRGG